MHTFLVVYTLLVLRVFKIKTQATKQINYGAFWKNACHRFDYYY